MAKIDGAEQDKLLLLVREFAPLPDEMKQIKWIIKLIWKIDCACYVITVERYFVII